MIALPAIDLRGGRVVQLVGGRPEDERVTLPDPAGVARDWVEHGFAMLHVVDLDAALGSGDNLTSILAVLEAVQVPVQVGGGIRSDQTADALLEAGASRIVVGTRGIREPAWLAQLANRHAGRVVLAADVRDGVVVTHGWTQATDLDAAAFLRTLADVPLAGVLVTDVGREGRMAGTDVVMFESLRAVCPHPLIASGGVRDSADLAALAAVGIHAVVLGMALYTGALDAPTIARSYGA